MTTSELFLQYHEDVRALARRIAPTSADADDLVSLTFETVAKSAGHRTPLERPRAYVLGVCANLGKHLHRAAWRRERFIGRVERQSVETSVEDPETHLLRRELLAQLETAVDALPEDQRVAFHLAEVEDRPVAEISKLVGAPEGTVRSRLFHARKRLREHPLLRAAVAVLLLGASAGTTYAAYRYRDALAEVFGALREKPAPTPTPAQRTRLERVPASPAVAPPLPAVQPTPTRAPVRHEKPVADVPTLEVVPAPEVQGEPAPAIVAVTRHQVEAPRGRASGLELYERARRLHLGAHDDEAAIAAWTEYLRVLPEGRFAAEARYERAVAKARLGRDEEALKELRSFADQPAGGFRQAEAKRLIETLEDAAGLTR